MGPRAAGNRKALETRESLVFASWLVTSLLAVAGALLNGWLGFALALAGGVVTGILCLRTLTNTPAPTSTAASSPQASPQASEQLLASFHSPATSSLASAVVATNRPPGTPSARATRRGFLYKWASALDRYELLILAAASPFFIFPQASFVWIGLLIPALWLNRLYVRGYVSVRSPLNIPLLLLLLMLGPSFLLASDHELALPKLMSVVLGLGLYMAILNLRQVEVMVGALPAIIMLALGLALIGYTGTDWPASGKLTLYSAAYHALPRLVHAGANSAGGGINPNETGGVFAWLVPFLAAAWLGRPEENRGVRGLIVHALLIIALVLCSILLLLTQSRGAIFAVLTSLMLLGLTQVHAESRVKVVIIALGTLGVITLIALKGPAGLVDLLGGGTSSFGSNTIELSLSGRVAIWLDTVELIKRYPLLGVGLAMFPIAFRQLARPDIGPLLPHAHNHFLQAAMDVGLPGLIAYVALLACVFGLLLAVLRRTPRRSMAWVVALALFAGLLAQQLYGLTDAITFAQRPGFVFWIFLGLTAYLWNEAQSGSEGMVTKAYNPSPIAD